MSTDVVGLITNATDLIVIGILLLGIYRAIELRRAFVNSIYRGRATWSGFLMLIILISFLSNYAPIPSTGAFSIAGFLPFVAIVVTAFAYADRSVLVAIETDFFHRDTLGWARVRVPASLVLIGSMVVLVVLFLISPPQPSLPLVVAADAPFVLAGLVLAYATAALMVGARRSADRTLRTSIFLLGLALFTLVLDIILTTPLTTGSLPDVVITQGTAVVGIYLIYRSVLSLSPLGRVQKDVDGTVTPVSIGASKPAAP